MIKARINGQEYNLAFTLDAWSALEDIGDELMGPPAEGEERGALDLNELMKHVMKPKVLTRVLAVLIAAAAALEDREPGPEANARWIGRHTKPKEIATLGTAVLEAFTEGMRMEADEPEPGEEVDVVLDELKKNDGPGE